MAFDDVRLPDDVERGAEGGPKFQTSIVSLGTGAEQRNVDWAQQRGEWDVAYGIQYKSDALRDLIKFFYARQGKARGFRFKDWSDFESDGIVTLANVGNGVRQDFQLIKKYTDVVTYTRGITRPVAATVKPYLNGVLQTTGFSITSHGSILFVTPPANTVVVSASYEFDVPVRFDVDHFKVNMSTFEAGAVPTITIVELMEDWE